MADSPLFKSKRTFTVEDSTDELMGPIKTIIDTRTGMQEAIIPASDFDTWYEPADVEHTPEI